MENQESSGQGSKKWFLKRHKRWTASVISKLMSEDGKPDKAGEVFKWGKAAKTALFSKFYQRLTDIMEKEIHPTFEMQRGADLEPLSIERFGELYMGYGMISSEDLVETGLTLFPDDDGTLEWQDGYKGENDSAGASPDKLLYVSKPGQEYFVEEMDTPVHVDMHMNIISGIETKSRGDDATLSHAYAPFDVKHPDFWQVMAGMHAHGCKYWYYNNFDDEKPENYQLHVKQVPISEMHVTKMCQKIKDADALIADYIKRCDGFEAMMPDERSVLLTQIRSEIIDLKEKW